MAWIGMLGELGRLRKDLWAVQCALKGCNFLDGGG